MYNLFEGYWGKIFAINIELFSQNSTNLTLAILYMLKPNFPMTPDIIFLSTLVFQSSMISMTCFSAVLMGYSKLT